VKLLLVEDDPELRRNIRQYLSMEGHIVEAANDFDTAAVKTDGHDYECVLVDITLPGGSGLDLVRKIKKARPATGVIIISAKNSPDDKVTGLDLGADDYIAKPFHLSELNARVKSLSRRMNQYGSAEVEAGQLRVNTDSRTVAVNDRKLSLTPKEYELLLYFIHNKNRVISKESIAERLWGDDISLNGSYDFIYSHVKNLRKKLAEAGCSEYVQAIYGTGYRFSVS
jgi:DNA-binding response OmpR family regulator